VIVRTTDRTMPASLELVAGNRLLASLPTTDRERIAPLLTACHVGRGENISAPWEPLTEMMFPTSSVISVVAETAEGDSVEVGTIGREGMVGSTLLLDGGLSPLRVMCQIEGDALTGTPEDLMEADVDGLLRSLVLRYANTLLVQASITAACNRLHPLEQRAARWLLTISDRLDQPKFDLTHEFFAVLIGAQRPSVTIAARELQQDGLITYHRGRVEITHRAGLRAAACGCYATITEHYVRSMGLPLG
jgi:CRP-like cAMP-binding protein